MSLAVWLPWQHDENMGRRLGLVRREEREENRILGVEKRKLTGTERSCNIGAD